jgi:hypothetical protein
LRIVLSPQNGTNQGHLVGAHLIKRKTIQPAGETGACNYLDFAIRPTDKLDNTGQEKKTDLLS